MLRKIISLFLCFIVFYISFSISIIAKADTNVGGPIVNNTIWSLSESPYVVTSDISVYPDATLIIEKGVTIKMNSGTALIIGGGLVAIGTSDEKIVFTSNTVLPLKKDWKHIKFIDSSLDAVIVNGNYVSGNIIKYCTVEYSENGIYCENSSPYISNNIIRENDIGILANGSSSTIYSNFVSNNIRGISIKNSSITIDNNQVLNNVSTTYGIAAGIFIDDYYPVSESHIKILNNTISNNEAKDYPLGGGIYYRSEYSSFPTSLNIENNIITDNKLSSKFGECRASGVHYRFQSTVPTFLVIKNNHIKNNISVGSPGDPGAVGGGIYFDYFPESQQALELSSFKIENNVITGNSAFDENGLGGKGGGIYMKFSYSPSYSYDERSLFALKNNIIKYNTAKHGGGIYYNAGSADHQSSMVNIESNDISENYSVPGGVGGIYFDLHSGIGTVSNNNIEDNQYYDLYNNSVNDMIITNNWWGTNNTLTIDTQIYDYYDNIEKGKVFYQPPSQEQFKYLDFNANISSGACPLEVNFTNTVIGPINSIYWDFGNDSYSSVEDPTYTYSTPGMYTVSLNVLSDGWSGIETKTDYIEVKPVINSQSSAGGQIIPEGDIVLDLGAEQTFFINAENGYYVSDIEVNGQSVGSHNSFTFENVNQNNSIYAYFCRIWYQDADEDGFGDRSITMQACTQPSGYVLNNDDCDDNDAIERPGQTWYNDNDNDGYSDGSESMISCERALGYKIISELISSNGDCNDLDTLEHPNQIWYKDEDDDRYSDGISNTISCIRPDGYKASVELITTSGDCNDGDVDEFPNQTWYQDKDDDGYGISRRFYSFLHTNS